MDLLVLTLHSISDYDHEEEDISREELVSYIDGSDEPEEPDLLDKSTQQNGIPTFRVTETFHLK